MGRPTKLTKEMQDRIVRYIRLGSYVETSCILSGINKTSYYLWMKLGKKENADPIYRDFYNAIIKAQSESEMRDLQNICNASHSDWCASAWKLERKYPNKYGLGTPS